ncbi:MAG TPA: MBL fold metallo-hydrolase [Bryobacteraceae bacterium]|nr:MBL fold metallo-hydrolase [Bryobacteraceae bacterium]
MKLIVEALEANTGDCLLLHYGGPGKETRILIDGGNAGVYQSVLKSRLEELRGEGRLDLRMVMVSHIDADHITGIEQLLGDLVDFQESCKELPYRIRSLWHNSFDKLLGDKAASVESSAVRASLDGGPIPSLDTDVAAVVASVKQGNAVRNHAVKLGIPINADAGGPLVQAPAKGVRKIQVVPGLTFTLLSPHQNELDKLDSVWDEAKARKKTATAQAADFLNKTVPNLSSIVVLMEAEVARGKKKRLLFTGDAGGDVIREALAGAKLLQEGRIHVDLLKVQHHGSSHSSNLEFFQTVLADHYVISGNGRYGIPDPKTLEWLSEARRGQVCDVYLTNRTGGSGFTANIDMFLAAEETSGSKIRYHFRGGDAPSICVPLAK